MEQKNKFSDYINELTELWWNFIRFNEIAIDKNKDFKERRIAAEQAEKLIQRRYEIQERLDEFFI